MKVEQLVKVVYAIGFLDLFGVSMTIPLLAKHARDLGASPSIVGFIGSLYGFLQLVSSPSAGRWSDRSGRRHVLLSSLLLSTLSYALLGAANTVLLMALSRLLAGLFKHSQELSKAFLSDIMPKTQHSHIFGRFNSISSVGFIFGPIIGGHLSDQPGGFAAVSFITAAIFFLNLVLVYIFIPANFHDTKLASESIDRSSTPESERSEKLSLRGFEGFNFSEFMRTFREVDWRNLWDIFLARFLLGFAVLVYRSNFSAILDLNYQASGKVTGYMIAYSGVVGTVSGLFVGRVADYYNNDDARLLLHSSIVQTLTLLGITLSPNLAVLVVMTTPLSVVNAIARVTATNLTLARGTERDKGQLMGLGASVLSLARMAAPAIGGIAQEVSIYGPGFVGTLAAFVGVVLMVVSPLGRSRRHGVELTSKAI